MNRNSLSSVAMPLCREADGAGSGQLPVVLGIATGVASGCEAADRCECTALPFKTRSRDSLAASHQP